LLAKKYSGRKTMFTKILVPLDGSELAVKILPQVVELAKTQNAQVTLLYVYDAALQENTPAMVQEVFAQEAKRCETFLAEAAKDLEAQGVKASIACVEGSPAREIIAYAEAKGMNLIAMATHGKGEVAWVLGSVAEKVVSHATVPVLLFRVLAVKLPQTKEDYFLEVVDRGIP
jgi:nucleotide-binding universal stress UspA family protein